MSDVAIMIVGLQATSRTTTPRADIYPNRQLWQRRCRHHCNELKPGQRAGSVRVYVEQVSYVCTSTRGVLIKKAFTTAGCSHAAIHSSTKQ